MTKLKSGDPTPGFTEKVTDGSTVSSQDRRGKRLILYFYLKDDTPGCTAQACALHDANRDIVAKCAAVRGVSSQDEASHQQCTSNYKLNFPLIADRDRTVSTAYGSIGGGGLQSAATSLAGLADRVTFIIDEKSKVRHVTEWPNTKNPAEEVLALRQGNSPIDGDPQFKCPESTRKFQAISD